jgi:hypothetical protein
MQQKEGMLMSLCKAERCNHKQVTRGYCSTHYSQFRRHGRLVPETEHIKNKGKVCLSEICKESAICKGYCQKHYRQIKRHGRLKPETEHKSAT